MRLKRDFFQKTTIAVAKGLLGQSIVRQWLKQKIRAMIIETEAYIGRDDLACHASRGRTKRSEILFWKAGHAYVYLIYGMHHCFNVVTERENYPAAVLIRGVIMPNGQIINGPGRVCKALKINGKFHGQDLIGNKNLWFDGQRSKKEEMRRKKLKMKSGPRIGVGYAGSWAKKPWRFWQDASS